MTGRRGDRDPDPDDSPVFARHRRDDLDLLREAMRRMAPRLEPGPAYAEDGSVTLPGPPSVFGVVARTSGTSLLTDKRTLIAFSHVLEEECGGDLAEAYLFGAFQRPEFYEPARRTWTELAGRARSAYVFADFDAPGPADGDGPAEVALNPEDPMRREWLIVIDRPHDSMALSAIERIGQEGLPDDDRLFDSSWTTDQGTVRKAARVCAQTAAAAGSPGAEAVVAELALPMVSTTINVDLGQDLLDRLLERIDD